MLSLLPLESLIKTGDVDHADWNYRPVLGFVQRQRYGLVDALLPKRTESMLEIGYGSGVLLPHLAQRCERLYGIDIHERQREVEAILAERGVSARLFSGSAMALPFDDESFDVIVAVSTIEFVEDAGAAAREIARTLKRTGFAVVVTPADNRLLDLVLHLLTGVDPSRDFGSRRAKVLASLGNALDVQKVVQFPPPPLRPTLYRALRLVRREAGEAVSPGQHARSQHPSPLPVAT